MGFAARHAFQRLNPLSVSVEKTISVTEYWLPIGESEARGYLRFTAGRQVAVHRK